MNLPKLGTMVGPLPLGGWVAAVGGSVVVATFVRRRQAAAKAAAPVLSSGAVPYPDAGSIAQTLGQSSYSSDAWGLAGAPIAPAGQPQILNNTDWERAAATVLIQRGSPAYAAQQALRKYLRGLDPLNASEQAMVDTALQLVGLPPQPPTYVPPATVVVDPPAIQMADRTPVWAGNTNSLPTGHRYQVSTRPLPDPNEPAQVFVSIGGQFYRAPNASAIGAGIPVLQKGTAYYLEKTADIPGNGAVVAYMDNGSYREASGVGA